ncbi:DNA-binding transcriptional regulator, FadR family [Thalassobacillus cyri]|uniref:DNA-binding transcriptional regulator, FadR family n=1 Tax=Thalassobacillus cyri TaxID=571932 RepID=A0A1H4E2B4_9BACI|nr:FadR/GntR family transcriptional regulator [Thalassobacillus cyri]SEA78532.1 DNA-binding transcriptional regulator, FadR family [Thalassobacillus cyri]
MQKAAGQLDVKSVKRDTLSSKVIDQIIHLLVSGQLKPGDKLPTEMDLQDMFQVSRPVLREAISSLETIGVVRRKTREGTFFTNKIWSKPYEIMLSLSSGNIRAIAETRMSQELGLVSLAAEKISDNDLHQLWENIGLMERQEGDYREFDKDFHRIIAYSASNSITEGIIDPLLNMFDDMFAGIPTENKDKRFTIEQHKQIYYALEKRDPIEAHLCMYRHLDHARNRLLESVQDEKNRKG